MSNAVFAKLSERGTIVIPEALREGFGDTTVFEVVRRDDGVIELRPLEIDPDQAWFWTNRWQAGERAVEENYAAGRYETFDDVESFLADLDAEPRG